MVSRLHLTPLTTEQIHLESLPHSTSTVLQRIADTDLIPANDWYLAGGTALALQVGHRQSVDLDFFTERKSFTPAALERTLQQYPWITTNRERGTLYGEFDGVQMSFIAYPFFEPSSQQYQFGSLRLMGPHNIAAMKIIAISQRGRKRDFVDLYWYCKNKKPLIEVFLAATNQYPQDHNIPHLLKSLVYFDDAEDDPMPKLLFDVTWPEIKKYFEYETPRVTKQILRL